MFYFFYFDRKFLSYSKFLAALYKNKSDLLILQNMVCILYAQAPLSTNRSLKKMR